MAHSYRGPRSDHFDGQRFYNLEPFDEQPPAYVLRWQLTKSRGQWRDEKLPPGPPPPKRVGGGAMRVTFVNHATVLIQMDSLNILTDPVWSNRIGPEPWVGTKRHRPPGIPFEDLPPIDVVLLSHDHYDHMDLPTLRRLAEAFHPRIITGLGNRAFLRAQGVPGGRELDWWRSMSVAPGVAVTAVPAQHWSGRTLEDHRRTLWMGFVIEGRSDTVYFAGDTGWGRFFRLISARYRTLRLALLPIAPFLPHWYMHRKHMSPEDAVRAARELGATTNIAIHWGTFELGDDGQGEPIDSLERALDTLPPPCRPEFWVLQNGEGATVPPVERVRQCVGGRRQT